MFSLPKSSLAVFFVTIQQLLLLSVPYDCHGFPSIALKKNRNVTANNNNNRNVEVISSSSLPVDGLLLSLGKQKRNDINNSDDDYDYVKEEDYVVPKYQKNSRRGFLQQLGRGATFLSCTTVLVSTNNNHNNRANAVETLVSPPPIQQQPQQQLTSSTSGLVVEKANPNLMQFETAGMIPRIYFEEKRSIYGFVERVMDGDTIRVTHVPSYPINGIVPSPIQKRGIADITIAVRFYGIDAPEIAKNKNQTSQPFGEDAKQYTYDSIYHKMVKVTLLQKDKYGRVVGAVETVTSPSTDLSIELAKRGLAELYTGGGAQYWNKKEQLVQAETEAQKAKRGIWSLGDARISAAEQKRMLRNGES